MTSPSPDERQKRIAELIRDLWPHRLSGEAAKTIDRIYNVEWFGAERDLLAQAIWDARAALGFDTDGDQKFHSTDWAFIAKQHVTDATDVRAAHEEEAEEYGDIRREQLVAFAAWLSEQTTLDVDTPDHAVDRFLERTA